MKIKKEASERHVLTITVDNEAGILAKIAGLFTARGYNIDSLTVADITENHAVSRITIVTHGPPAVIDQIHAQLDRLVPVHKVIDLTEAGDHVERELALVKVSGTGDARVEALRLAEVFRAKVVDTTTSSFIFELTGTPDKLDRFVSLMRELGLVEVGRTGVVGMMRGAGDDTAATASPPSNTNQKQRLQSAQTDYSSSTTSHLAGRSKGLPLDNLGLPSEADVTEALLGLLFTQNDWIEPSVAYDRLADHFGISSAALNQTMSDGRNHWQNRVQWARKALVDRGLLDNSRRGFWKLYN